MKTGRKFFEQYIETMNRINYKVVPTPGVDSGAGGKSLEASVKMYLDVTSGKAVSDPKKTDVKVKINGRYVTLEIKSGGGVIVNSNGVCCLDKSQFFGYVPRYNPDIDIEKQVIIYKSSDIKAFMFNTNNKVLRHKRATNNNAVISIVSSVQAWERIYYADIDYMTLVDFRNMMDKFNK